MKSRKTESGKAAGQELGDTELDSVVGGCPLPYPSIGTSDSGGKVEVSGTFRRPYTSSTDDQTDAQKDTVTSKETGSSYGTTSSGTVIYENDQIPLSGDPTTNN